MIFIVETKVSISAETPPPPPVFFEKEDTRAAKRPCRPPSSPTVCPARRRERRGQFSKKLRHASTREIERTEPPQPPNGPPRGRSEKTVRGRFAQPAWQISAISSAISARNIPSIGWKHPMDRPIHPMESHFHPMEIEINPMDRPNKGQSVPQRGPPRQKVRPHAPFQVRFGAWRGKGKRTAGHEANRRSGIPAAHTAAGHTERGSMSRRGYAPSCGRQESRPS